MFVPKIQAQTKAILILFYLMTNHAHAQFEIPVAPDLNQETRQTNKDIIVTESSEGGYAEFKKDLYYNSKGQIYKEVNFDLKGPDSTQIKEIVLFLYDQKGNPTEEKTIDIWGDAKVIYRAYDDMNRISFISIIKIDSGGTVIDTLDMERNSYITNQKVQVLRYSRFEFDDQDYYYSEDPYGEIYEYNKGNNEWVVHDSVVITITQNGIVERMGSNMYRYLGDSEGRLIKKEMWDFSSPERIHSTEYSYENGQLIFEKVYKINGDERIEEGNTNYTYSGSRGQLIRMDAKDEYSIYSDSYEYDKQGRLLKVVIEMDGISEIIRYSYRSL
ncbi:hypothetical protein JYT74_00410 [Crocinitomix catalasitica]|nr:hypothetical protein [Crocinitomix catalasitica]